METSVDCGAKPDAQQAAQEEDEAAALEAAVFEELEAPEAEESDPDRFTDPLGRVLQCHGRLLVLLAYYSWGNRQRPLFILSIGVWPSAVLRINSSYNHSPRLARSTGRGITATVEVHARPARSSLRCS